MSSKLHLLILAILLTVVGIGVAAYKVSVLHLPLHPEEETYLWSIEAAIQFTASSSEPVDVTFLVPPRQNNYTVIDENFISKNYGLTTSIEQDNRVTHWISRNARGNQTLYYRTLFYSQTHHQPIEQLSAPAFPEALTLQGASASAAENILATVRGQSLDSATFALEVLKTLQDGRSDDVKMLLNGDDTLLNITQTTIEVLKGASIASRLIHGFYLNEDTGPYQTVTSTPLLAVWDSTELVWNFIDTTSAQIQLPNNYFIWWFDEMPLINVSGGNAANVTFTAHRTLQSAVILAQQQAARSNPLFSTFSLSSLPLQSQQVYQVLIMVPLGALIIVLLRNVIGISTFGTFMPVLIALAFRETQLVAGLLLFILVVALGLAVRFYLEHLKLLLIPRIAVVLSAVILIMLAISTIGYHIGFGHGLSIALFPMVIIAMTIERMSIVWEERNPLEAILQGIGSLFAATLSYLAMSNLYAEYLFFIFPELILVMVSFMLLLGHYHGYRFLELFRFKALIGSKLP